MAKAERLKKAQYDLGLNDALLNKPFRWQRHPYLLDYRRGWKRGKELEQMAIDDEQK